MCLNYGGRDEILRAARRFATDCAAGKKRPEELDDALFSSYLDSAGIPDPELIIRPSGELRLSNFLLWQLAYSEFYFTDVTSTKRSWTGPLQPTNRETAGSAA